MVYLVVFSFIIAKYLIIINFVRMFGRNFVNEKIHFLIVPINSNDECEKNGSRKKMEKGKIQGAEEAKRGEVENKSERLLFKRK